MCSREEKCEQSSARTHLYRIVDFTTRGQTDLPHRPVPSQIGDWPRLLNLTSRFSPKLLLNFSTTKIIVWGCFFELNLCRVNATHPRLLADHSVRSVPETWVPQQQHEMVSNHGSTGARIPQGPWYFPRLLHTTSILMHARYYAWDACFPVKFIILKRDAPIYACNDRQ